MFRVGLGYDIHKLVEARPLIIAGCSDATFKLVKSKLLSKGYFFTLASNNQVLKIFWE